MSGWLDRLREAGEKATPGPWDEDNGDAEGTVLWSMSPEDYAFVVLARNTWPLLVAVAEAAENVMGMAGYKDVVPSSAAANLKAALASLREAATE